MNTLFVGKPLTQRGRGAWFRLLTGGTCSTKVFSVTDQEIRTEYVLSWKPALPRSSTVGHCADKKVYARFGESVYKGLDC